MPSNQPLYQRKQVYRLDQQTMQLDAQPSQTLMLKAATATWNAVQQRWPDSQHIVVLAGAGNNGGDAFALACLASEQGKTVSLFMIGDENRQSTESACYRQCWLESGGKILPWQGVCPDCDIIIDGLLGIGLNKELDQSWQQWISNINSSSAIRVSIDIPSGLNADTGNAMPVAIRANLSVSFVGRKVGCWLADGPDYCGELLFDDLGMSSAAAACEQPLCHVMSATNIRLPSARPVNTHKNQFGHILVIGGDRGMSGAVRLAAMAALRSGAGLVSVCVHPDSYAAITSADPELMTGVWDDVETLVERATIVVVGPGLGRSEKAKQLLEYLKTCHKPMLVDADALQADFLDALQATQVVITPHPGEAARLLGCSSAQIQQDRIRSIQQITQRWHSACVLKGAGSLVGQHDMPLSLCANGHSGMATAGSGDILSGLIAGYMAQHLSELDAARCGVYVHARSAEHYALDQQAETLIASDLIKGIGKVHLELSRAQGCAR